MVNESVMEYSVNHGGGDTLFSSHSIRRILQIYLCISDDDPFTLSFGPSGGGTSGSGSSGAGMVSFMTVKLSFSSPVKL